MLSNMALFVGLALLVIVLTRLIVRGIELFAAAGALTAKSKGQFLGYATSLPELVGTVGTAGHGLLGAGLWNVAASNIINWVLFAAAAVYYGRIRACAKRKFADELGFAAVAFMVPLVLSRSETVARSPWTGLGLFAFFVLYVLVDKKLNPEPPPSIQAASGRSDQKKPVAVLYIVLGLIGIVVVGQSLGGVAEKVVRDMKVPEWAVGWVLGFITSLPEMTAFFAVFASAKEELAGPDDDTDCQENLDGLCASNMSNLALIYPVGILVYLLVGQP